MRSTKTRTPVPIFKGQVVFAVNWNITQPNGPRQSSDNMRLPRCDLQKNWRFKQIEKPQLCNIIIKHFSTEHFSLIRHMPTQKDAEPVGKTSILRLAIRVTCSRDPEVVKTWLPQAANQDRKSCAHAAQSQ